ncbi:MAG: hypothetical protein IPH75_13940 [bacterium]|nr:hypothetical protein [bacterium]
MVKKARPAGGPRAARAQSFDFESSRWFVPVMFLVMLIALVTLFGEFIFSDKMLDSSDTIQAGMFFRSFIANYFNEHGSIPVWNPYIFGGMPYIDAFHGDIFYPLSIIKFFMSTHRFLGIVLVLHIYLAGIFMFLCARQFKLSKVASIFSAIGYMFAMYLVSMVSPGHDGKMYVTALFPLAMLFLDRTFERRPFFNSTILGLIIGLIILTPHVQLAYYSLWSMALYTVFRLVLMYFKDKNLKPIATTGSLVVYAVVIGVLLSAIQFYPGYQYTTEFSPRADSKRGWEWATSWSMHAEEAASLVLPEFSGTADKEGKAYYWGKNYFKDNSESICVSVFFLGLMGMLFVRRKEIYFFAGLAFFALLYALGGSTPVFHLFYWLVPLVKSLRAPSTIMFVFSFSMALVAGMTIQHFMDTRQESPEREKKLNYYLWGFPAFSLLLALGFSAAGKGMLSAWTSIFYSEAASEVVQKGVTKLDLAYANLPQIQAGAWFVFLFVTAAAVCIWMFRSGKAGVGILVALAFVPMVEGMRFNARFIDTFDPSTIWAPNPVVQYLKDNAVNTRVLNLGNAQDDVLPYHGIEVVAGYHGNQLRWYDDLLGGPQLTTLQNNERPFNPRFLNLVGMGYYITPAQQKMPDGYFGPLPEISRVATGNQHVWENPNAFPRAYLVGEYKVLTDRKEIYPQVLTGNEDLRKMTYLEKEPGMAISPDFAPGDSAWVIYHGVDSVAVGVQTSSNKLLILTDVWYDSWHPMVDGQPAELLRSYGAFRAVVVPSGARVVTFKYESSRYSTGRLVTWLTSLYIVCIIGFHETKRRMKKRA